MKESTKTVLRTTGLFVGAPLIGALLVILVLGVPKGEPGPARMSGQSPANSTWPPTNWHACGHTWHLAVRAGTRLASAWGQSSLRLTPTRAATR